MAASSLPANAHPFPFIAELDEQQREAATTERNAVVSAGAGSGKTRVLTARYGYLIMSGRFEIDQILTITFTNKAANEMYRRIYALLSEYAPKNEYAQKAVDNFHKARICTLDSFCAGVARTVSRRFGISAAFKSSEFEVKETARSLALRFVLDNRTNAALQALITEKKLRTTAQALFAEPMVSYSTVSAPLDFNHFEQVQRQELIERWNYFVESANVHLAALGALQHELPEGKSLYNHLSDVLPKQKKAPAIDGLFGIADLRDHEHHDHHEHHDKDCETLKQYVCAYLDFLSNLASHIFRGKITDNATAAAKESFLELKKINEHLKAIANSAFQWGIVQAVFPLLDEYQQLLNQKKRETGMLTFNDIAQLAVDGLARYDDIRQMYRDSLRMIMIDEFQDNNSLQRQLVDLLAVPASVFYVGDEKQSIYRFRGADVSVFRELARQTESRLYLSCNYRSHPALIAAFNMIFGGLRSKDDPQPRTAVFPSASAGVKDYQALYQWTNSPVKKAGAAGATDAANEHTEKPNAHLHFAFFDQDRAEADDYLGAHYHEAAFIAQTILSLTQNKQYAYSDCAVLLRSSTHQHDLERALKHYGIPFNAARPAAFFSDAPFNDIRAFLTMLIFPDDCIRYGALLRSPFVRLSEEAFTLCMLEYKGVPFDQSLDAALTPQDCRRYQLGRSLYQQLLRDAQDRPLSDLITRLWYDQGYRYQALSSASAQRYLDHYDILFEQSRIIEARGGSLVDFLEYLQDLATKEEKAADSILGGQEGSAVHLMTIHHCKGLEFPVVFVYGCGSREQTGAEQGLAAYSEQRGLFLKLPKSEALPDAQDCFLLADQQEHRNKTEAELRRLLYVAMTRAEQHLFVSGIIPGQTKDEQEALTAHTCGGYNAEFIAARLRQYQTKETVQSLCFLRLLPALETDNPLYTIAAIDVSSATQSGEQKTSVLNSSLQERAARFTAAYKRIPRVLPVCAGVQFANASTLHIDSAYAEGAEPLVFAQNNVLDDLLTSCAIGPAEFGTIVHRFIEAAFTDQAPKLPSFCDSLEEKKHSSLFNAALALADGFFNSPLGAKARSAAFCKTEYAILTTIESKQETGQDASHRTLVSGIIDLLFDDGAAMYIVDFKTDKAIDVSRHSAQLAVYKQAVQDIFCKPVECRLFYLRESHEVDPAPLLNSINLAALVAR